jgi:hypothetical protein
MTCSSNKKVDTSNLNEYVDHVNSLVQASNALCQTWTSIKGNLVALIATPDALNDQLKSVEDQCKQLQDEARTLEPPDNLKDVNFALQMCLEQRYRAIKNYRPDLVNAIAAADTQVYSQNISADLQELVRSDGSYYYFKQAVGDALNQNNTSDVSLPDSVWVPDWDTATVKSVEAMLVSLKGTEVHGMALGAVTLTPAGQVVDQGGETVHSLPSTDEVSVTINIQNQGTRVEKDVAVSVSLYSTSNPAPTKQDQTIPSIDPGQTLQVVFQGLKPTSGGVRNVLEIKVAPVPLEVIIDNNQKLIYFTVG